MNDEELEKLRRKKLQELQQQINQSIEQEVQQREIEEMRRIILRSILTPEAKERLSNIRIARPAIAEQIENQLILLAQSGRLRSKVTDEQLRMLLEKLLPKKREIRIRRR